MQYCKNGKLVYDLIFFMRSAEQEVPVRYFVSIPKHMMASENIPYGATAYDNSSYYYLKIGHEDWEKLVGGFFEAVSASEQILSTVSFSYNSLFCTRK